MCVLCVTVIPDPWRGTPPYGPAAVCLRGALSLSRREGWAPCVSGWSWGRAVG